MKPRYVLDRLSRERIRARLVANGHQVEHRKTAGPLNADRQSGSTKMCLNCGCGQPNERHGNDANIILDDVRRAGEANGQSLEESLRNMGQTSRQALSEEGGGSGGSQARPSHG